MSGELGLREFLESQRASARRDVRQGWRRIRYSTANFPTPSRDLAALLAGLSHAERIAKAEKLKLAITAGIGSDHVDLEAAIERGVTVAEVTYCNSISVSEHVVMTILALVRNYRRRTIG